MKGQLGFCYLEGRGCRQDMEVAFQWTSLAANTGHPAVILLLKQVGLDAGKLIAGYKQFQQFQSAMTGNQFGENFEQIFSDPARFVSVPQGAKSGEC